MAKIKQIVKENKGKIILITSVAAGAVGAGILYYKFGIKPGHHKEISEPLYDTVTYKVEKDLMQDTLPVNLGIGEVVDLWRENDAINLIVNDITVNDLGKLGECMTKVISDTTGETTVSAVIGLSKPEEVIEVMEF